MMETETFNLELSLDLEDRDIETLDSAISNTSLYNNWEHITFTGTCSSNTGILSNRAFLILMYTAPVMDQDPEPSVN